MHSRARSPRVGHVIVHASQHGSSVFPSRVSLVCPAFAILVSTPHLTSEPPYFSAGLWSSHVGWSARATQRRSSAQLCRILCERLLSKTKTVETRCHSHLGWGPSLLACGFLCASIGFCCDTAVAFACGVAAWFASHQGTEIGTSATVFDTVETGFVRFTRPRPLSNQQ